MGHSIVGGMAVGSSEEAISLTGPRIEMVRLSSRRCLDRSNDMPSDVRTGGDSHKPMEAIHGTSLLEPAPSRHNEAKYAVLHASYA